MIHSPEIEMGILPVALVRYAGGQLPSVYAVHMSSIIVSDDLYGVDEAKIEFAMTDTELQSAIVSSIRPGGRLAVDLGYGDNLLNVFEGEVAGVTRSRTPDGNALCSVVGRGMVAALAQRKHSRPFVKMIDRLIAETIADEAGFPMVAVANPEVGETRWPCVEPSGENDLTFLRERARLCGCFFTSSLWNEHKDRRLYFGPPPQVTTGRLSVGKTLPRFSSTIDISGQIGSAVVRGTDTTIAKCVVASADRKAVGFTGAMAKLNRELEGKFADRTQTLDLPGSKVDDEAAQMVAKAVMVDNARRLMTGEGETPGRPALQPGAVVEIEGVESPGEGLWLVTAATHTWNGDGFATRFKCSRLPY